VTGHGRLEDEEQDGEADEDQAGHVERQAAEADERQDQGDRAEVPVTKFGLWSSKRSP
jgi:hypothetical protein